MKKQCSVLSRNYFAVIIFSHNNNSTHPLQEKRYPGKALSIPVSDIKVSDIRPWLTDWGTCDASREMKRRCAPPVPTRTYAACTWVRTANTQFSRWTGRCTRLRRHSAERWARLAWVRDNLCGRTSALNQPSDQRHRPRSSSRHRCWLAADARRT